MKGIPTTVFMIFTAAALTSLAAGWPVMTNQLDDDTLQLIDERISAALADEPSKQYIILGPICV